MPLNLIPPATVMKHGLVHHLPSRVKMLWQVVWINTKCRRGRRQIPPTMVIAMPWV